MSKFQRIMAWLNQLDETGAVTGHELIMLFTMACYIRDGAQDVDKSFVQLSNGSGYSTSSVKHIIEELIKTDLIFLIGDRGPGHSIYDFNLGKNGQ